MSRNKQASNHAAPPRIIFLMVLGWMLCWSLAFPGPAEAAPAKVSLVLGDIPTRTSVEAVKSIYQEYPDLKKKVTFQIYSGFRKNLAPLGESNLILIMIMGHTLLETVKPELQKAMQQGGKVVCVNGGSDKDSRDWGIQDDPKLAAYFVTGGRENMKNMILYALKQNFAFKVAVDPPVTIPDAGIYDYHSRKIFTDREDYRKVYNAYRPNAPWIGVIFYKFHLGSGQTQALTAICRSLEGAGFNVLPVFGPLDVVIDRFLARGGTPASAPELGKDHPGSQVRLVVALGLKVGITPSTMVPGLAKLQVPVIDAISLSNQSKAAWEKSPVGLSVFERSFQIANPEIAGIIQPTVVASKESRIDKDTGLEYVEEQPLPERINRLTARVKAWINLQDKPNKDKRIALVYYNYPPGKNNIGAATLNVLPDSLWEILLRLKSAGYDVGETGSSKEQLFRDIQNYGRNIGNWAPGEVDRLVKGGERTVVPADMRGNSKGPVLLPLAIYRKWFQQLPARLQRDILKSWGPVEKSTIMIWKDARGEKYLVIPAVRYGNILLTPQPARGWGQDIDKLYHDVSIPPHHQYVAFYLWLKYGFKADALAQIGTHGTHEWLSGKEVGFTREDPPEALIQDLPNIYPYVVDNVGEGLQAKRRGLAVIIDHMTPPFDKAGLNKDLKELAALVNDYRVAGEKGPALAAAKLKEINGLAQKQGVLADLKLTEIKTGEQLEELQHYLEEIGEKQTPFGLHTLGKSPEEKYVKTTAEAILAIDKHLTPEDRQTRLADLEDRIRRAGPRELNSFLAALSGKYIPAGPGNDPIRNPDSLPTGKNFYAFDPTRIPTAAASEMGVKLARELIDGYKTRHGQYPDKLTFNLWATETIRNEGVMETQIMDLLGIKPKRSARGQVVGVEAIPRRELGRPRIDVTVVPSGLYRDLFPNLMNLLDQAVTLAKQQTEADNLLRAHIEQTKEMLIKKGLAKDLAERLASVRLFTTPPGAYGPNLETVINKSDTWGRENQVADVYLMRMSHPYGQGFWGDRIPSPGGKTSKSEDLNQTLFKSALSGTKLAVHSLSGNVFSTLDIDDYFQELGGVALAIRSLDGKSPEVYVSNLANPKNPRQETIERVMGEEMRSRYLNAKWIEAMMQEGYAGARVIDKVVEHLWGWQVTVPEAVDAAKWNEMFETYVADKNGLEIKQRFKDAGNMWAYQSLVARMLETVRKGYWKPDKKVVETLSREYAGTAKEVGLACCDHTCNNPLLTDFAAAVLMSVPGLDNQAKDLQQALDTVKKPQPAGQAKSAAASPKAKNLQPASPVKDSQASPDAKAKNIEGYELQEVNKSGFSAAPIPYLFMLGFLVFLLLIRWGWRRKDIM